jgi:hypothetical protein
MTAKRKSASGPVWTPLHPADEGLPPGETSGG